MRDRTADLLRARQALSQLSYSPSTGLFLSFVCIFALRISSKLRCKQENFTETRQVERKFSLLNDE
jgi:hypothetical protein